jgi:hypothetical protein
VSNIVTVAVQEAQIHIAVIGMIAVEVMNLQHVFCHKETLA